VPIPPLNGDTVTAKTAGTQQFFHHIFVCFISGLALPRQEQTQEHHIKLFLFCRQKVKNGNHGKETMKKITTGV
jgi:hypothetical protein